MRYIAEYWVCRNNILSNHGNLTLLALDLFIQPCPMDHYFKDLQPLFYWFGTNPLHLSHPLAGFSGYALFNQYLYNNRYTSDSSSLNLYTDINRPALYMDITFYTAVTIALIMLNCPWLLLLISSFCYITILWQCSLYYAYNSLNTGVSYNNK